MIELLQSCTLGVDYQESVVLRAATALGEAGKAGDLEASKGLNSDLQRELGIVEHMIVKVGI